MEYTFSEDQRRVAKEFARASLSDGARSKCYGSRGNDTRSEKLFSDFANGALAEMAGHAMLKLVFPGAKVSEPDFTVYKVNKKSFDADITLKFEDKDGNKKEQVNALVKSFFKSRDVDFAPSFCFQKVNGRRHADKELSHLKRGGDATDLLVCALVVDSHYDKGDWANADPEKVGDCCVVYGPFAMQDVEDQSLWRDPYIKKLARYKRVLYLHDLLTLLYPVESITID